MQLLPKVDPLHAHPIDFVTEVKKDVSGNLIVLLTPREMSASDLLDRFVLQANAIYSDYAINYNPLQVNWVLKQMEFYQKISLDWDGNTFHSPRKEARLNKKAFLAICGKN